jgi:hypothetical protein
MAAKQTTRKRLDANTVGEICRRRRTGESLLRSCSAFSSFLALGRVGIDRE